MTDFSWKVDLIKREIDELAVSINKGRNISLLTEYELAGMNMIELERVRDSYQELLYCLAPKMAA